MQVRFLKNVSVYERVSFSQFDGFSPDEAGERVEFKAGDVASEADFFLEGHLQSDEFELV